MLGKAVELISEVHLTFKIKSDNDNSGRLLSILKSSHWSDCLDTTTDINNAFEFIL